MRIAIMGIKALPAFAGADRVVEKLLDHMPATNEYYIYLLKGLGPNLDSSGNKHYIYLRAPSGKHLRAFFFFLSCSIHCIFKDQYNIVHVHNSDFGFFLLLLKLRRRIKIVGTLHGDPYKRKKWGFLARLYLRFSEYLFVRLCDTLVSVSPRQASHHLPVVHIPNGIDHQEEGVHVDSFDISRYGVEPGKYFMFACGRLDSTKGLHHLLVSYHKGRFPEKLLVIGDFEHDVAYSRYVERLAKEDSNIVLHKRLVPEKSLLALIRNSKLFVFPSEVEAMSMMLLEAISCTKLVICSDIPENVQIVGPDYEYLFSLSVRDDLLVKLRIAREEPNKSLVADRLYTRCSSRFNWHSAAEQYSNLYDQLLTHGSPCSRQRTFMLFLRDWMNLPMSAIC